MRPRKKLSRGSEGDLLSGVPSEITRKESGERDLFDDRGIREKNERVNRALMQRKKDKKKVVVWVVFGLDQEKREGSEQ
jgi:hypothetical protein